MSSAVQPIPENERSPFPDKGWRQVGIAFTMLGTAAAILLLMGRHPVCPCGTVSVWQWSRDPAENSQAFADWYSLLHVVFGMALFAGVRRLRPHWSLPSVFLAVILGHSIWEVAENTPLIIGIFSGGANAPHYEGDSLLNSFGDTVFALGGAGLMPFLRWPAVALVVVAVEAAVTFGVGDGFVVGTLRLFGVDI
ncbi:DUF2585 family protein [Aureimonas leprariae]|nr:DUF2585 family protein [Aureimonas leprariae]